jgi:hypothetical protein
MPGTASRFIPLKQPGAYPITTGIASWRKH